MTRTRRSVIRAGIALGATAGLSGTALAGKKKKKDKKEKPEPCNKFGTREEQPGQANGQAVGHNKSENDPGGHAHDRDGGQPGDRPGERVGHCKYD